MTQNEQKPLSRKGEKVTKMLIFSSRKEKYELLGGKYTHFHVYKQKKARKTLHLQHQFIKFETKH